MMGKSESHIPLLDELTRKLSHAPADNPPNEVVFAGKGGTPDMVGRTLYRTSEVAIMQVFLPKGNVLPAHRHDVKEWLICFHGKIELKYNGETLVMGPGVCKYLPMGLEHESTAIEDSKTIVITIPADKGFPDAR